MKTAIAIAALLLILGFAAGEDCVWDKDADFPSNYPPLLVDSASWSIIHQVFEGSSKIVRVLEGTTMVVACPGELISILGTESVEGVCVGGKNLDVNGELYTINDLACSARVDDDSKPLGSSCGDQGMGQEISIGFNIIGYPFVEIILVCFEPVQEITLYTRHILFGASIDAYDSNPDRPSFDDADDGFYTMDPNECYLTAGQDIFFEDLTGDPDYIDTSHSVYFSRGHLAPNADFITEMEADATFYYYNVVPQWQPYNGGNWMYLESDARDLAATYNYDFVVWTGPWEQLEVVDSSGIPTPVYICNTQSLDIIPIPSTLWKVVYDPQRDLGVAIITSNEPHEDPITPYCAPIDCTQITWLSFDDTEAVKGTTYCCTIQDLRAANPNAPDLPTAGILFN